MSTNPPQSMIVLVSEQLWPNLSGVAHWFAREGGLDALCIYYTADEQRSVLPARRLERICARLYPGLKIIREDRPGDNAPEAVWSQVYSWIEQGGENTRWVINASGGTKLMFAGVLSFLESGSRFAGRCRVIYCQMSPKTWFNLFRDEQNLTLGSAPFEVSVPSSVTDSIPVVELINMQSQAPPGMRWSGESHPEMDLILVTRAGIELRWDWKSAFQSAGLPCFERPGFLFEKYFGALIAGFGLTNLALNLSLSPAGSALQEIDIAVNHNGRIFIFDLKLSNEATESYPLITQIAQGANIRSDLGGPDATMVLVRPGRRLTKEQRGLAEAKRIEVWDQDDMADLVARLAKLLQVPVPETLSMVGQLLRDSAAEGAELFAETSQVRRHFDGGRSGPHVQLSQVAQSYFSQTDFRWFVFAMGQTHVLYLEIKDRPTVKIDAVRSNFQRLCGSFAVIEKTEKTDSRNAIRIFFTVLDANAAASFWKMNPKADFLAPLPNPPNNQKAPVEKRGGRADFPRTGPIACRAFGKTKNGNWKFHFSLAGEPCVGALTLVDDIKRSASLAMGDSVHLVITGKNGDCYQLAYPQKSTDFS